MSTTPIPLRVKIDAMLFRAAVKIKAHDGGMTLIEPGIFCGVCSKKIEPGEKIDWDHNLRENAGGTTDYMNIRPLHRECHKEKRRVARSKATTLGKDNFEAKKTARMEEGQQPSDRPMGKTRGFDKRLRKRMNGKVELREPT